MKKVLSIVLSLMLVVSCMALATVSASADRTPRYTVLVLDVSTSLSRESFAAEQAAAIKFCETATRNSSDKVSIVRFSTYAYQVCEFTNDLDKLTEAIDSLYRTGATDTYEALVTANEILNAEEEKGVKFERNIVFCSDGLPNMGHTVEDYKYTQSDYVGYKYANGALQYDDLYIKPTTNIYTIGFFEDLSKSEMEFAPQFMEDLANRMSIVVDNADDLIQAFDDFAEDITKETEDTPTPDTPQNNNNNNNNNANNAAIAAAIYTGTSATIIMVMIIAVAALGMIAVTAKKRTFDEK